MDAIAELLKAFAEDDEVRRWGGALLIMVVGYGISRLLAAGTGRVLAARSGPMHQRVMSKAALYIFMTVAMLLAIRQAGFDLTVLLGAAGILTVAIGFASQTSASNIISGIFMLGERPFVVGDILRVGEYSGQVVAIDLLSVKLRTFDNLSVRVPNEYLLKTPFVNVTHHPIRRCDIFVNVSYRDDLKRVEEVLRAAAEPIPFCLDEPSPVFIVDSFGESATRIQFSAWSATENYIALRNDLHEAIKSAFDVEGIEIPFPQRTVHTGTSRDTRPSDVD